jgi:hypothetical protein
MASRRYGACHHPLGEIPRGTRLLARVGPGLQFGHVVRLRREACHERIQHAEGNLDLLRPQPRANQVLTASGCRAGAILRHGSGRNQNWRTQSSHWRRPANRPRAGRLVIRLQSAGAIWHRPAGLKPRTAGLPQSGGDHPHPVPVVGQFPAAIETGYVCSGERRGGSPAGGKRKRGPPVMADEHCVENRLEHRLASAIS